MIQMDKTKRKLAAFFEADDDEPSFPQKEIDDQKKTVFTQGTVRKSKKEKEKEAAEAKRKEEEEQAARAYAEFLDAFQGEGADRKKGGSTFVKAGQDAAYAPSAKAKASMSRAFEQPSMRSPSPPPAAPKPKGKRAMDSFLEEIKREQADREARLSRHAYEGQSGSKDRGDPETTNLFVTNLPAHVNEQTLGMFFARAGPVGSVKIMWPRSDASVGPGADMTATRRSKNSGLSGFVSFMKRRDAEEALREFDGYDWGGSILRAGAKLYQSHHDQRTLPRGLDRGLRRDQGPPVVTIVTTGDPTPVRHRMTATVITAALATTAPRAGPAAAPILPGVPVLLATDNRAVLEDDEVTDTFIRTVAAEVRGHDAEYEETLKEREKSNSKYAFLHSNVSPINRQAKGVSANWIAQHRRHRFYRSLVEREEPLEPEFDDEVNSHRECLSVYALINWQGYNSVYSTDSAEDSERERGRKHELGKLARRRFEAMLRALSGRRGEMARCMAFSLEHAEAAAEVADIIVSSLVVDGTPVPRKVARLHLICDILHNSAAPLPMAWKFRQEFQSRLGLVFDHLSTIYHSFPGRITAETFKKQITAVVDIWEDWIVFPPEFTAELRQRLEGAALKQEAPSEVQTTVEVKESTPSFTSKFKTSAFKPADEVDATAPEVAAPVSADDDGEPMDEGSDVDGKPIDDVDGDPIDADVDGVPLENVDGEPMEDIDGEPVEDVDGEPMADDIDGAPIGSVDADVDGEPMDDVDGEPVVSQSLREHTPQPISKRFLRHAERTQRTHTDDDDRVVVAVHGDVRAALVAQARDVRALRADDAREHRPVGQREEPDVRHFLRVFEPLLDELQRALEPGLVARFERPHGLALLRVLVVRHDLPRHARGRARVVGVVDPGGPVACLGGGLGRHGGLGRLGGLVDVHAEGAKLAEEVALLRDGVMVLERNGDGTSDALGCRGLDLGLWTVKGSASPGLPKRLGAYLELLDGLLACSTRAGHLDDVRRVDARKIGRILGLTNLRVRARAGELDLRTGAVLEVVEVLAAATDERAVLSDGNFDTKHDAVLERLDGLLELSLEFGHELRFAAKTDLVGGLALTGATCTHQSSEPPVRTHNQRKLHAQSNQASLRLRVGGATATGDEVLEALSTCANDRAVELARHLDCRRRLLLDLLRDRQDGGLGLRDSLLRAAHGDVRARAVVGSLVDVDLRAGVVLDLVDRRAALTEDARDGAGGHGKLDDVLLLRLRNALAPTLDKHLISLELLASLALAIRVRLTRERDLDPVLLLQTGDVLAVLANKRRMVLVRDFQDLRRLVGEPLRVRLDAPLRLLHVLLAPDDLDARLLVRRRATLLLLPAAHDLLLPLLVRALALIREVDLHAERVAEPVHARTARADDPADELAVDLKLDRVAAHDLVVLGVLDDLENLADSTIDVCADAAHKDRVLGRLARLRADLDRERLVLANDGVERSAAAADDRVVPLLLDSHNLGLHIGSVASHLQQLLLNVLKVLGLLNGRRRGVGRGRVVNEEHGGLLSRLGWEEDQDVVSLVEAFNPGTNDRQ
ncbi:LOW QUALITY PROTEIN: hypothetical protein ACG7TL_005014 [Trametes sanguinea]